MKHKVLVFESSIVNDIGYFQGYNFEAKKYLSTILNPNNYFFIDRETAETTIQYKQLISYVVLRCGEHIFTYTRGLKSLEERLIGLHSIGLGGHIESTDYSTALSSSTLHLIAADREVAEEVFMNPPYSKQVVALINDDTTHVGKVHFGILHVWDLPSVNVLKREEQINETRFLTMKQLRLISAKLEK